MDPKRNPEGGHPVDPKSPGSDAEDWRPSDAPYSPTKTGGGSEEPLRRAGTEESPVRKGPLEGDKDEGR